MRGEAPKCFCNVLGPSAVGKSMSHVSCLQIAMIVYGTTVGFASYLLAAKLRGNPRLSALCLALLGWAGTLVSTNWSQALAALILYRLLAKNAHRFSSTFWSFSCWFDCTKWLCTIIYCVCVLSNILMGFPLFSLVSWCFFEHQILM